MSKPARAIGRNTRESLASGLFYGYAGLAEEILRRLKADMGGNPTVLSTGGLAGLWAPVVPALGEVVPHLTLEGLRLIWYRNQ
jgi:type III pantothenate kinase